MCGEMEGTEDCPDDRLPPRSRGHSAKELQSDEMGGVGLERQASEVLQRMILLPCSFPANFRLSFLFSILTLTDVLS